MSAPVVLFYAFALLAVAGALGLILNIRNSVASAMSLLVTMVALAGIYVLLGAHLVAAFQIMERIVSTSIFRSASMNAITCFCAIG